MEYNFRELWRKGAREMITYFLGAMEDEKTFHESYGDENANSGSSGDETTLGAMEDESTSPWRYGKGKQTSEELYVQLVRHFQEATEVKTHFRKLWR